MPVRRQPGPSQALAALLQPLGCELQLEPEVASTSGLLKQRLGSPEGAGAVLLASPCQLAGRGTRGRSWDMQPGLDLAMTLALPLAGVCRGLDGQPDPRLPLLASAAVAAGLARLLPGLPAIGLRWPNDLLLIPPVAKFCGLLLETSRGWLLCGVGMNVNSRRAGREGADSAGAGTDGAVGAGGAGQYRSCSLRDVSGRWHELDPLAAGLTEVLLRALREQQGIEHWLREWSFRDVSAGGRYQLAGREGVFEALGADLESGALRLRDAEGAEVLLSSYQDLQRLAP
ncbi:hypothetical protein IT575_10285 [bacterium]|nr:hypothetical protein [bacterium]